jgi:hypothetical protein
LDKTLVGAAGGEENQRYNPFLLGPPCRIFTDK